MFTTASTAYLLAYLINNLSNFGPQISTTVAAIAVGVIANGYSRLTKDVAIAPLLTGIQMIVPGSLGVKGSLGLLGNTIVDGTSFTSTMTVIGMSITVVLTFALHNDLTLVRGCLSVL